MDELFRDFWWLAFPLAWGLAAMWQGWLGERRRRDALDLVRAYADKGQAAPPELVRAVWGKEG